MYLCHISFGPRATASEWWHANIYTQIGNFSRRFAFLSHSAGINFSYGEITIRQSGLFARAQSVFQVLRIILFSVTIKVPPTFTVCLLLYYRIFIFFEAVNSHIMYNLFHFIDFLLTLFVIGLRSIVHSLRHIRRWLNSRLATFFLCLISSRFNWCCRRLGWNHLIAMERTTTVS